MKYLVLVALLVLTSCKKDCTHCAQKAAVARIIALNYGTEELKLYKFEVKETVDTVIYNKLIENRVVNDERIKSNPHTALRLSNDAPSIDSLNRAKAMGLNKTFYIVNATRSEGGIDSKTEYYLSDESKILGTDRIRQKMF